MSRARRAARLGSPAPRRPAARPAAAAPGRGARPDPLPPFNERELRRLATASLDGSANAPDFVSFVLEKVCGFTATNGTWQRGSQVGAEWGRRAVTGETVKPRQLWRGPNGAILPVFFDAEARLGIGRGRKAASQTVQWLRAGSERLALLTNGRQWRLIFAGLDFDAWCEWDVDLWFEEGALSPQVARPADTALARPLDAARAGCARAPSSGHPGQPQGASGALGGAGRAGPRGGRAARAEPRRGAEGALRRRRPGRHLPRRRARRDAHGRGACSPSRASCCRVTTRSTTAPTASPACSKSWRKSLRVAAIGAEETLPITESGKWKGRRQGVGSGHITADGRAAKRARREGPGPMRNSVGPSEARVR